MIKELFGESRKNTEKRLEEERQSAAKLVKRALIEKSVVALLMAELEDTEIFLDNINITLSVNKPIRIEYDEILIGNKPKKHHIFFI